MAPHDSSPKLTYEDYLRIPDDGKRHEIIDGEHYVTAAPFVRHQKIVMRLSIRLGGFVENHSLGDFLSAPTDVVLSDHDIVQPDLLFISNERRAIVEDKNIQGAPDLVIEILSERNRRLDEVIKRQAYERFGAREYWILDPRWKTVQVLERASEGLRRKPQLSVAAGDVLTTPLLPGLEISLAEIFDEL
jgi:Uma2 family endonuclease